MLYFANFAQLKKCAISFFANNFRSMGRTDMLYTPINWIFQAGHFDDVCYKTVRPVFRKLFAIQKWKNAQKLLRPFDDKNLKKIDFYVWYLKRTALKNVDWQWNRYLKILIFGEVMDKKVPKNGQNWLKYLILLKIQNQFIQFPQNTAKWNVHQS